MQQQETFAVWMRRQGYAERTITLYEQHLARVDKWLHARGRRLGQVTWQELADYAELLPYTHSSRAALRSAITAYWKHLGRRDCPAWAIPQPRKPRMVCRALEHEDVERLLTTARGVGPELYALVCTLYYLAFRREEAARLRWGDLDGGRVHVVGKGGIEAWLPVHPELVAALGALPRIGDYVFPGRWGGHIQPATVNLRVTVLAEVAGVEVTPHIFRHSALAQANDETGDLRAVQDFARHADPRVTAGYTRTTERRLRQVVSAL